MAVKATGREWKDFYEDDNFWPKGAWHEGEEIWIDGKWLEEFTPEELSDSSILTVKGGIVYLSEDANDGPSLETFFKRWRKNRNTTIFIVEVSKECTDAMRALIVSAGGKIVD